MNIIQVDAFTDRLFAGNPAAVCVMDGAADEGWMQNVAAEMNLSETAFLHREGEVWRLRWFTPTVEVDLCGHATLASAHVLWSEGHLKPEETAQFETKSGRLSAQNLGGWIRLDFPATPASEQEPPPGLLSALGAGAVWVGKNRFDYLVETSGIRDLNPDFKALKDLDVRGVMVTEKGSGEFDFISRFFAPGAGVDEDPVTGSAHCTLGPYWGGKLGKTEMSAHQASKRGGTLRLRLHGDRVQLEGRAVTFLKGTLA